MAIGHKTGGRRAGTPNKKTREVTELLRSLDCDPIEGMVRIAQEEKHSPELRGRIYSELAQYMYPKRRSVEMSAEEGSGEIIVRWQAPTDESAQETAQDEGHEKDHREND